MGPLRKSKSVNRRYINEVSPSKDGDSAKGSNSRKRKLSDMLGSRWATEELTRFYDAYRKYGKDWKKVAGAVRNRSPEMVEAIYTMNRAYLSLPDGTASATGLIAMVTDHYSNLAGSDHERECNDGAGSSRKTQKRVRGNDQPTISKAPDDQSVSHSQTVASDYGFLSTLRTKCSEDFRRDKVLCRMLQGLKLRADANDDEVAHEIAMTLAEAPHRGGSPQVARIPSKRPERVMLSPSRHVQRKHFLEELANTKTSVTDMDEADLERNTDKLSRHKPSTIKSLSNDTLRKKARKSKGKKSEVGDNGENCLVQSEEDKIFGAITGKPGMDVTDTKIFRRSSMQSQKKKSKKVLFRREEAPSFDALQNLADLSLMMPIENEDDLRMQFKDESDEHDDKLVSSEVLPMNNPKASSKISRTGKPSVSNINTVPEKTQDYQQSITKTSRRKKMLQMSQIQKPRPQPDSQLSESTGFEVRDAWKNNKKSSQNGSPNLKNSKNYFGEDLWKEADDSSPSASQVPVVNQVNLPTKVLSRRKMHLRKPEVWKDLKFPDKISNEHSIDSLQDGALTLKGKFSSCLENPRLRRWCTYEWFYSAIDYPWFAKREFVEYLYHVGLGHVPRLTRVEWGVIRSSLGKPRRFSGQFLKEEKEKLNKYRDSVRKHYSELREGVRDGLPTDLARPLSVGQRVIAIHPKTREIHDGGVLTVDHSRCRIQFDRHEQGVEFVRDIDCMPLNPFENMPAILLGRQTIGIDKFFEHVNKMKINRQAQEFMKLCPGDNVDNTADGIKQSAPLAQPASSLKQTKVASANANLQKRTESAETLGCQQTAFYQIQSKEADVRALSELTRALDKKEAVVLELRRLNDDVFENQKDVDSSLKDSEPFKKHYAAVLVQLSEANEQVSCALHCLRQRNTYQGNIPPVWPRPCTNSADYNDGLLLDRPSCQTSEPSSHENEIIDSSRTKARSMVAAAVQEMSSFQGKDDTIENLEEAIDYVNERLPYDDSSIPILPDPNSGNASDMETQIPSDLISKCVATLLMIQKFYGAPMVLHYGAPLHTCHQSNGDGGSYNHR
ncbi:hypothetical protein OROGR_015608 [Orobanche gracilis]